MRVVFAADDESPTVDAVRRYLDAAGVELLDSFDEQAWPRLAAAAATAVAKGEAEFGVLLCWTGTGTAMVANKIPGVRAALAWEPWIAIHARLWNDANVLTMSLKRTAPDLAVEIVQAFLGVRAPDPDEAGNIELLSAIDRDRGLS
jgi:ribose 5-phosphate isomerase B